MGFFLREPQPKRVRIELPCPTPHSSVYDVMMVNGSDVRIIVEGREGLVMGNDGSVTINLEVLLSAKAKR